MEDRELLELAAKAAKLKVCCYHAGALEIYCGFGDDTETWNPLTDDGDALWLAVKLGMMIDVGRGGCHIRFNNRMPENSVTELGDPLAATRRAIVLAAAEIGRRG